MDKYRLYKRALLRVIKAQLNDEHNKQLIIRNIFYGVKLTNSLPKATNHDEAVKNFNIASVVKKTMGLVTPKEFINIFPIDKDFKGYKYETKDYFYTRDYINQLDHDRPIGVKALELTLEYQNREIKNFTVALMSFMNDISCYEGKPSIAEEWANMNGISMKTMYTDNQGNEYLMDEYGKTHKVTKSKPRRPKHIKLVQ